MPMFDYKCPKCGYESEKLSNYGDKVACTPCSAKARKTILMDRLITSGNTTLKGLDAPRRVRN